MPISLINIFVGTVVSVKLMFIRIFVVLLLLIIATQSHSQIAYKGGVMQSSETWTNDSTYVVYSDLIIPDGVILTIQEGVLVKIQYPMGIIADSGIIRVNGTESDSVRFVPGHSNPGQFWKWEGIIIKNANIENENYIHYAQIIDAETAIKIEDSRNVVIENSSMQDCQNLGIHIVNSSSCYIFDCNIENNYDGIEILAGFLGASSDNVIYNCIIKNQNHNIYIYREEGGIYQNNVIFGNLIGSGNNGIWINNNGGSVNSENIIEQNIIINNGSDIGYGLFLAHDSTIVVNNIFWRNNVAVFSEQKGDNCLIANNSFYENNWAIAIGASSTGNKHLNNTFSLNSIELLGIKETQNVVFSNNNLLHNFGLENIIVNNTSSNLSIIDNYWGTTDTSVINSLIYDSHDDPVMGKLDYIPYLQSIDTTNPISPPYQVIKQIVGNNIQVSWRANQEADLMGYRIHYGNYNNYSFHDNYEIGNDTLFTFPGDITIYDSIAVTAVDSTTNLTDAQLSGHESPFAFAAIYPYAGGDTIICKHLKEFEIQNGNVPFGYQTLFWSTSGDGVFNNTSLLAPIYFPGLLDIENGGAVISLNVVDNGKLFVDSFQLSIIDDPVAFAGNDTVVIADAEIALTEAVAQNFDEVRWFTSGDGSFDSDTLVNPVYFPGNIDIEIGVVFLEFIAFSDCGIATDSIKIVIEPYFSIEGKLWANQRSVNPGVVIAYRETNEGARAMQIESTESDGTFRFENVMIGNYFIYALPDTNNLENLVPGYYANKLRWQSAYLLPVDADVYDIDIHLPENDFTLPTGDASISGHMLIPEQSAFKSDIYCAPWFDDNNNEFCRGGLSNITVLLFNDTNTKLLDYTLTDELGDFYFSELPYGSYIVDAEKAGFLSISSPVITLSPEHKSETGVVLEIDQYKIGISFNNISLENNIVVFPNPATHEINIPYSNPDLISLQIEVYDLYGNRVLKSNISSKENLTASIKIDIAELPEGLYIGQISSSNNTTHFRFVKR